MAAATEVTASSSGMPAATRAPNTISSRISVTGSEVPSALLKVRSLLIACWMLASPDSAMRRSGWRACTAATAFWSAVTAWLTSATLPGAWKVTRALRPSFETSDCPPADSGLRMPAADFGRADRDRKSTRLNSSHVEISYAVFCLKKKKKKKKDLKIEKKKKKKINIK